MATKTSTVCDVCGERDLTDRPGRRYMLGAMDQTAESVQGVRHIRLDREENDWDLCSPACLAVFAVRQAAEREQAL